MICLFTEKAVKSQIPSATFPRSYTYSTHRLFLLAFAGNSIIFILSRRRKKKKQWKKKEARVNKRMGKIKP
jgi:hypothetical protein